MIALPAVFRSRRRTPYELAATLPHHITESQPSWTQGLLMLLAAVLALGWIDANDRAVLQRAEATAAEITAAYWKAQAEAVEQVPAVRLEGDGFTCRHFHVRREWTAAVSVECERMATLLRTARAAP